MPRLLIKVAKELEVGTSELVEILRSNGFQIENKPTARVSDDAFKVLVSVANRIQLEEKINKATDNNLPENTIRVAEVNEISVGDFCRVHDLSFRDIVSMVKKEICSLQSKLSGETLFYLAEEVNRLKSEEKDFENIYPRGTVIETKILYREYPQGIIVEFDMGYRGYISIQNLAPSILRAEHIFDSFRPGGTIKCVVYRYDHINKVCHLSRRHTIDYTTASLQRGDVVRGRMVEQLKSKCVIHLETGELGLSNLCHENPLVKVLGYNEIKGVYSLEEHVEETKIRGVEHAVKKYDELSFVEPELSNYLSFEKSSFGVTARADEKAFLREQFRSDDKIFTKTLQLQDPIYLKFFNDRSWYELKREVGEDNIKETLELLVESNYWIRYQFNEKRQSEELILYNEETFIKAKVEELDDAIVFIVDSFSVGRKHKWSSSSKKRADNYGALLNQTEVIFLNPDDNIPFNANQASVIESIQYKFQAFDILKSLKERTGAILQTEGEALNIFGRFLEYQISLERAKEREPVKIEGLKNYPSSSGWIKYLIKTSERLIIPEGGIEIGEKISTEKKKTKETFRAITSGRLFEELDQWFLEIRDSAPDLTIVDNDLYIRERLQIYHLESQKEIIEDFLNKKINVGHIEKLLVDPGSIKPPKAADIDFYNADLATTFVNEPTNKQIEAVRKGVGNQNIFLIQGPPGTGKTTVIAEIVQQLIAKGETILISSQGHVAVDNVLEKLAGYQGLLMTRIGNEDKIDPSLVEFQEDNSIQAFTEWYTVFVENQLTLISEFLRNDNIKEKITEYSKLYPEYLKGTFKNYHHQFHQLLLTIEPNGVESLRLTLEEWKENVSIQKDSLIKALFYKHLNIAFGTCLGLKNSRDLSRYDVVFDTLILDEAGKANMAETFVALSLAKKVILVGDQKQLPPYLDSALIDPEDDKSFPNSKQVSRFEFEKLKKALSYSFFEFLVDKVKKREFPEANLVMLNVQHRMHPSIGNLVSESFYGSKVESAQHTHDNRIVLPSPFHKEIVFVDTSNDKNPYEKKIDDISYVNELEASYITKEIIPRLLEGGIHKDQVAVISPYKYQVNLIKRQLVHDLHQKEVTVETLDSFQGKEFDIIIISFTRSHKHRRVGFLDDARRLNVALSRAKKKLILVGNEKTLCSSRSHFDKIFNYTDLFKKLVSLSSNNVIGNFFQLSDQFSIIPAKPRTSFKLEVGEIVNGKVQNIEDYGAFIDLEGGFRGLCFLKNLTYGRINHPSQIVSKGDEVRVKVLKVQKNRISLGLKQVFPHPWNDFIKKIKLGQVVESKIVAIESYGAFFEIIPGVEGLLHVSMLDSKNPIDSFQIDHTKAVCILKIDKKRKRVELGLKGMSITKIKPDNRNKIQTSKKIIILNGRKIEEGQLYVGKYYSKTDDYFVISLFEGIVGYLKISKYSTERIKGLDQLPEGFKIIKVQVDNIEEENKIYLSLA